MKRFLTAILLSIYLSSSTGCGLLLHPERQGQKQGKIDVKIAILDGIGLLFYVVPGLVAFGIDFYQGTIYLPNSSFSSLEDLENSETIQLDEGVTEEEVEEIIRQHTGVTIDLSSDELQAFNLEQLQSFQAAQIAHNQLLQQTARL